MFDITQIRKQFPIFKTKNLVYLDSAASSQKPSLVIDGLKNFYENDYSNIHRGAHFLGDRATDKYENTRKKAAKFFGTESQRQVVFTKNATEALNLVARSLGDDVDFFSEGDRIILTKMEHHSNLIPWLQLAQRKNLVVEYIDFDEEKNLNLEELENLFKKGVKLLSLTHVSNVLGTKNQIKKIVQIAKKNGATIVVDGCQAAPHIPIHFSELGADFYALSAHKMYGPTGVGVLLGNIEKLKKITPFLGGGEMIRDVEWDSFTTAEIPYKFEAGTMPIAEVVGLGYAIDFLENIGMKNVEAHNKQISQYALKKLSELSEVHILSHKKSENLTTFSVDGVQNYDISDYLSDRGICIRVGHHCAQPLHGKVDLKTSLRASYGVYTTKEEIDVFVETLKEAVQEVK